MPSESGFTVDPPVLREVARSLILAAAYLDSADQAGRDVSSDTYGSARLAAATKSFVEHWNWQATRLSSSLSDTASRLQQAASQYQDVESAQLRAQGQE